MDWRFVTGNDYAPSSVSVSHGVSATPCYRIHRAVLQVSSCCFLCLVAREWLISVSLRSSCGCLHSPRFRNVTTEIVISLRAPLSLHVASKTRRLVRRVIRFHALVLLRRVGQFLLIRLVVALIGPSHSF